MPSVPNDMIRRSSYVRKSYTRKDGTIVKGSKVKSSLIVDRGQKGKGKKLFEIKDKGFLTEEGYSLKKSSKQRRQSLKKASKEKGSLKVLRHLNAIRTLQKSNPENFKKLDKDVKFVQKEYRNENK
jgi:NDP-sugar pyrophosphorylase family protein